MDGFSFPRLLFAGALVLLLPGGALLAWLRPDSRGKEPGQTDLLTAIADVTALSIAIPALLALWLFVGGIRVDSLVVVGAYLVCLLLLSAGLLRWGIKLPDPRRSPGWWIGGLFSVLFLVVLIGWRFYQAQSLVLPAWVDSVHHTLIVRKIGEYGGIPPDLTPYLPVALYYHYGFHLITALFAGWAGVTPDRAVLWFGQVINALVALSVYRAGRAFDESSAENCPTRFAWWMPATAAVLVGFVFQMPAYYLTWGRYTLLTGLVLLGPAMAAALEGWRAPWRRDAWVRLALLTAGITLTHYFVLFLFALFLLGLGLFALVWATRRREGWGNLVRLGLVTLLGIGLALPWIVRVWGFNAQSPALRMIVPSELDSAAQKSAANTLQYLLYLVGPRRGYILMGIAGVGWLLALIRSRIRLLAGWTLLLLLFTLPWGLRIGPFRPDHFAIILFFPAALLIGVLLVEGAAALGQVTRPWVGAAALAGVTLLLFIWGARETRSILNPTTVFVTPADVSALEWVKANTPSTARFYINSTPWQSNYRGLDGGYWLLPYTGRGSLIPPVIYGYGTQALIRQINSYGERSGKLRGCTPDFWNLVRENGLTHIYVRQGTGALQPQTLANCPRLRPVYQQGGVSIYEILPVQ